MMPISPPSQAQDKFIVRMPGDLRDRIKRAADRSGRSMNAEVISVLEREFPPDSSDITLRELDSLIAWVQDVNSLEDLKARQEAANTKLAPRGSELYLTTGRDGRLVLTLLSNSSVPGLVDSLSSSFKQPEKTAQSKG